MLYLSLRAYRARGVIGLSIVSLVILYMLMHDLSIVSLVILYMLMHDLSIVSLVILYMLMHDHSIVFTFPI
jgi:hypothetical protein